MSLASSYLKRARLFQLGALMISRLLSPTIRDKREIGRWVALVTISSISASVGIECLIEWLFWVDRSSAMRGFMIAFFVSGCVSAPIAFAIAHIHLALYEAKQAAERASLTDPLTGLMNRRALTVRAKSLNGVTLALVIADIDHFKRVNDTYGHLAGDQVIAAVGRALAEALAEFGPLARVGGEEFALLAGDASSKAIAQRAEAARRRIAETPIVVDGRALRVTISAGLATAGSDHKFDTLYSQADRALYLAKTNGRNRALKFEDVDALGANSAPGASISPEKMCA